MPKELEIKPDNTLQKAFYVGGKTYGRSYHLCYDEVTKKLYQIYWYEGYDEEAKEIKVSADDIMAILTIIDRYGFTLEGMKPILTSPSTVEKGEEKKPKEVK